MEVVSAQLATPQAKKKKRSKKSSANVTAKVLDSEDEALYQELHRAKEQRNEERQEGLSKASAAGLEDDFLVIDACCQGRGKFKAVCPSGLPLCADIVGEEPLKCSNCESPLARAAVAMSYCRGSPFRACRSCVVNVLLPGDIESTT